MVDSHYHKFLYLNIYRKISCSDKVASFYRWEKEVLGYVSDAVNLARQLTG